MIVGHRDMKWACSCGHENKIQYGICARCHVPQGLGITHAKVIQEVSQTEKNFYTITMPNILGELRTLTLALRELVETIKPTLPLEGSTTDKEVKK
jgi:hypothetical protein